MVPALSPMGDTRSLRRERAPRYPDFRKVAQEGRDVADADVALSLLQTGRRRAASLHEAQRAPRWRGYIGVIPQVQPLLTAKK